MIIRKKKLELRGRNGDFYRLLHLSVVFCGIPEYALSSSSSTSTSSYSFS